MSKPASLFEPWHYEAEHGKIIGADGQIVLFVASARLLSTDDPLCMKIGSMAAAATDLYVALKAITEAAATFNTIGEAEFDAAASALAKARGGA